MSLRAQTAGAEAFVIIQSIMGTDNWTM